MALALAACAPDHLAITVDPPAGTDYIAVLLESSDGTTLGSTAILHFNRGAAIHGLDQRRSSDVARVRVSAWSAAALGNVVDLAGPRLEIARVAKAGPDDALLPTPTWIGAGAVDGGRADVQEISPTGPGANPFDLTAPYLPLCPTVLPDGIPTWLDADCEDKFRASTIAQSGCGIYGGSALVDFQFQDAMVDKRGRLYDVQAPVCAAIDAPPEAALSVSCSGCRLDVYTSGDRGRFRVGPRTAIVANPPPFQSAFDEPRLGYATSIALLPPSRDASCPSGQRVAVLGFDGRVSGGLACTESMRSRVVFADAGTGAITSSVSTPPCLLRITPDPASPGGFLGLEIGGAPRLIRFDCRGRELNSTSLARPNHVPSAIALAGEPALAVIGESASVPLLSGLILAFDPATLALVSTATIVHPGYGYRDRSMQIFSIAPISGADGVAVGTDPAARLCIVSIRLGGMASCATTAPGSHDCSASHSVSYAAGTVVSACPDDTPVVHVADATDARWIGAGAFYEQAGKPTVVVGLPAAPPTALVTVTTPDGVRAALFDAARQRFLPGSTVIGQGLAGAAVRDAEGGFWVLLPWTGEIVRVALAR